MGGRRRSRSKRDTPEPDTPIREKMPIGEAGESFPQLVDSSVEFSTCVDLFHPHVWKTPFLRCCERQPSGFASANRFASLDRLPRRAAVFRRRRKGLRGRCVRGIESAMAALASAFAKRLLRGSCGAEFVSEAQGRIVSAARRAARSARFGVERRRISRPVGVSVCTASPPERRGGPQGE